MMPSLFRRALPVAAIVLVGTTAALRAEDYAMLTYAGTPNVSGSADGSPGSFRNPYGIAVDAERNLYLSDTLSNTIRKISPAREVTTLAGSVELAGATDGSGSAARFNFPVGIAADAAGNIYVADAKNFTIRKITPAGVVSTYAGASFQIGSSDGPAASARFFLPYGVAADAAGNLYIADGGNQLIRKITAAGIVSTLAGAAMQAGFVDGAGGAARFNTPWGITVDQGGALYVADSGNNAIRKLTSAGVVTTLAGNSGVGGTQDGVGASARFNQPRGLSVNAAGNVFVADYGNQVIRFITPGGVVSTIAGLAGIIGDADSVGPASRFYDPTDVVADGSTVYVVDSSNNLIRKGVPASTATLPAISNQPVDQVVSMGQAVTFRVVASGSALTYRWIKNGAFVTGATGATLTIASAQESDIAVYSVRITGAGGAIDSTMASLSVFPVGTGPIAITGRPLSLAVSAGQSATFSVVATGSGLTYQWLKNGAAIPGATGASYAIASAQAADDGTYTVRLTSGSATETASAKLVVGAGGGASITLTTQPASQTVKAGQGVSLAVVATGSTALSYQWFKNDIAIAGATNAGFAIGTAQVSDAGNYTVRVSGGGLNVLSSTATLTVTPVVTGPTARLVNLSILTDVATAGDSFTMGYVVGGAGTSGAKPVLIRAAGPSLAPLGVTGFLADPKLELFAGSTRTGENDNWGGTSALTAAFSAVGAFAYINNTSLDAAALVSISAGDNSVRVSASGAGTGTVIAELYDSTPIAGATATTPRLVNVSVLKHLGTGLTAGFVIDGTGAKTVLIRAIGPTIGATFNVPGVVADPQLTLFSGQTSIGSNDNWGGTAALTAAFGQVGAFVLPAASRDAALLATLQPGNYTVQVSGVAGTTGVGLVEVYEVP